MLRLVHALHEAPPDPVARKRIVLERLCTLLRADAGVIVASHGDRVTRDLDGVLRPLSVSVVRYGMTEEDARGLAACDATPAGVAIPPSRRRRTPARGTVRSGDTARPSGNSRHIRDGRSPFILESILEIPGMRIHAYLALLRRRPVGRPFSRREWAMLDLVHTELEWVYGPELPLLSPDGLPLSPRQRQTLQLLLAGNSEKEIAAQMGLSQNTVHHYVKAIHRHFGVSSRSELLARWVRK